MWERCYHDRTGVPSPRQGELIAPRMELLVRIANVSGRLTLVSEQGGIDVATASASRFGPDPQAVYGQWETFRECADGAPAQAAAVIDAKQVGPPAPRPAQVFAIGMNYRDHPPEAGLAVPATPPPSTQPPPGLPAPSADLVM